MNDSELRNNLVESFKKLSVDEKRNEFNKELISLGYIVNTYLKEFDMEEYPLPKNYVQGEDAKLDESSMLDTNYIDLLEIKNRLVLLLKFLKLPK